MPPSGKKILICEDEKVAHTFLLKLVNELGYEVESAWSGEEAARMIALNKPDIVLLDMLFPDMDGVAVLNSLQDNPTAYGTNIIVMSASSEKSTLQRLGRHFVAAILAKPIKADVLQATLERLNHKSDLCGNLNVLVVDDSPVQRKILERVLQSLSHKYDCNLFYVSKVEHAVKILNDRKFSVILADAGNDPNDLLPLIQNQRRESTAPVILYTSVVDLRVVRSLRAQGVHDILLKPLQVSRLTHALEGILRADQASPEPPAEQKTVLVVEDFTVTARNLEGVLQNAGYRVPLARNGELAYEIVRKDKPDLILLDLSLPGMDGIECIKAMRQADIHVPFMVLSGTRDPEKFREVRRLGGLKIFAKPVSSQTLIHCVNSFFAGTLSAGFEVAGSIQVLIAIDDESVAQLMSHVLQSHEISHKIVTDGNEALQSLALQPRVVVVKHSLGNGLGRQIIRESKCQPSVSELAVLVLMTDVDRRKREEMLKLGADEVMSLPVDMTEFSLIIKKLLSRATSEVSLSDFKRIVLEELEKLPVPADNSRFRDQLRLFAHNIAGSAGLVCRDDLSAVGRDIEDRACAESIDRLTAALDSLRSQLNSIP